MGPVTQSGRISCTAIALVALLAAAMAGSRDMPAPAVFAAPPTFSAASQPLPAGLSLPPVEARQRVVGVVAADIDDDGDLDVVVNDGSLDLAVWVNDGTGHLTRKRAARPTGWRMEPPLPSLHDSPLGAAASVLNDAPPIGADVRAHVFELPRSQLPLPLASGLHARFPFRVSVPRAPPVRS